METLAIGEMARRAGVRPSTLRYYEDAGLLEAPARVNKRRRYDPRVLHRLAVIQWAQQAGFTLAEIRTLFHGFPERTPASARWETMAQRKLVEVEELIVRARGMKELLKKALRCGCLTLEDCALVTRHRARSTPSA